MLPSPPRTDISEERPMQALLSRHRGAPIHLFTPTSTHHGRLVGYYSMSPQLRNPLDNVLILDENGSIAMHTVDDLSSLSIKIDAPVSDIEQYLPHTVGLQFITLTVVANGNGPGDLSVSYVINSPHKPAYDIVYRMQAPALGQGDERFSNVRMSCIAVVPNPTPFDLEDVELCLLARQNREDAEGYLHNFGNDVLNSKGSTSSRMRSRSPSSSRSGSSRSRSSSPEWRQGRYRRCEVDSDAFSASGAATEADFAYEYKPRFCSEVPHRITLNANHSTMVSLFETTCEAGLTHYCCFFRNASEMTAVRGVVISNTTDTAFEPGSGSITFGNDEQILFKIPYLAPGEFNVSTFWKESGVCMKSRLNKRVNDVSCRSLESGSLRVNIEWIRTVQMDVHNKEDSNVEFIIGFVPASTWGVDENIVARLYEHDQDIGKEGSGVLWKRMEPPGCRHSPRFKVPLNAGQKRTLVVDEKVYEDRDLGVTSGRSSRLITRLMHLDGVTQEVADTLWDVVSMWRRMDSLKRTSLRYERKMCKVQDYADRVANDRWTPSDIEINGEHEADIELRKFFEKTEKAESTMSKLQNRCDSLAEEIVGIENSMRETQDRLSKMMSSGGPM